MRSIDIPLGKNGGLDEDDDAPVRQTIKLVIKVIESADGQRADWIIDGGDQPADIYWSVLDGLKRPTHTVETRLLLDTGEVISLPLKDFAYLLPDRSGVLVIFKPGSYTHPDGSDIFPFPNHAAIFNADGSLRCQVRFAGAPERSASYVIGLPFTRTITHKELPIGRRGEPIDPPIVQFGVLVGTKEHPPESFYVLNTETGELTDGLFTVPY